MKVAPRLRRLLPAAFLAGLLCPVSAGAQAVVAIPSCGPPNAQFTLKTNNWHRKYKSPVKYSILWDRMTQLTPFVFGYQPSFTTTRSVPGSAAAGLHEIQVLQIEDISGGVEITACRSIPFNVTAATGDPWSSDLTPGTDAQGRNQMTIEFDPTGACAVPDCNEIHLIQVATITVVQGADSFTVNPGGYAFWKNRELQRQLADDATSPENAFLDELLRPRDPYMTGLDPNDDQSGRQSSNPRAAIAVDAPHFAVPEGVDRVRVTFEVNAFCAQGGNRGEFIGKTFWTYERHVSESVGRVFRTPDTQADRAPPTETFMKALARSNQNRGFPFPKVKPPKSGGVKCSQFSLP